MAYIWNHGCSCGVLETWRDKGADPKSIIIDNFVYNDKNITINRKNKVRYAQKYFDFVQMQEYNKITDKKEVLMDTKAKKLTNEVGAPVAENEHSLT
ncbi:hypothetical protein, partial [Hungatella hathewayi]|uniref:hypothetical protein n=1 Tax=Hungatella hathewayi TaxID=154046 RepID=UPI001A996D1E